MATHPDVSMAWAWAQAVAVVGFLLMSRLRGVPFNGLLTQKEPGSLIPLPKSGVTRQAQIQQVVEQLFSMFPLEEVVQILNVCAKPNCRAVHQWNRWYNNEFHRAKSSAKHPWY